MAGLVVLNPLMPRLKLFFLVQLYMCVIHHVFMESASCQLNASAITGGLVLRARKVITYNICADIFVWLF